MAKTAVTTPDTTAIATQSASRQALAVSDRADINDTRGKESIDKREVRLPRIAICQKTSPQLEENKPEYIADIRMFEMFNSMTSEVYGKGPLEFIVIAERKRAMQFDADNKVVDFDVPWNDKRCQFTVGEDGTRVKPVATQFFEFIVLLPKTGDLAVLTMSKTSAKTAADLETYLTIRKGPSWAGRFTVSTFAKAFGSMTAGVFKVLPAGPTPDDLYDQCAALYDFVKASNAVTDTAGIAADETTAPASRQAGDEDIPY